MKLSIAAVVLTSSALMSAQAGVSAGAQGSAAAQPAQRTDRAVSASSSGSANAQAGGAASGSLAAGTTINAELTRSVDARKAKPGEEVTARVRDDVRQDGKVVLRHGTKLFGHVTEAKAKASGAADSELGIIFDRAELKGGQSMELHAAIQALAPAPRSSAEDSSMADVGTGPSPMSGASGGGGGAMAGIASASAGPERGAGGLANATTQAAQGTARSAGAAGRNVAGNLNAASRGVVGIPGVQINEQLSSSTNGSVLVSNDKNIHLDSGSQLVLRIVGGQNQEHR